MFKNWKRSTPKPAGWLFLILVATRYLNIIGTSHYEESATYIKVIAVTFARKGIINITPKFFFRLIESTYCLN